MSRSLLLLVAAMCSASLAFADTMTVTIRSEPRGARVYYVFSPGEVQSWGEAPVTKRFLLGVPCFSGRPAPRPQIGEDVTALMGGPPPAESPTTGAPLAIVGFEPDLEVAQPVAATGRFRLEDIDPPAPPPLVPGIGTVAAIDREAQPAEEPCLILTELRVEWASGVGASQHEVMFYPKDGPTPTLTFTRPEGVPGFEIDQAVAAKIEEAQRPILPWTTGLDFYNSWRASQQPTADQVLDRQIREAQLAVLRQQLWDQYAEERRANIERFRTLRCTSDLVYRTVYTTCR